MDVPEMINAGELVLKRWEPAWAVELADAVGESLPEFQPYLPWAVDGYGLAESRAFIQMTEDTWAAGTDFNYTVFTTIGELVGAIGLMTRMGPGTLEIGYWIRTPFTGRGYATAAVAVLTRVALTLDGVERVVIRYDETNKASAAVTAKAGFTEVERSRREPDAPAGTAIMVTAERRS